MLGFEWGCLLGLKWGNLWGTRWEFLWEALLGFLWENLLGFLLASLLGPLWGPQWARISLVVSVPGLWVSGLLGLHLGPTWLGMGMLGQWWQRARRAGHAYAEGAALHGSPPERHNVAPTRRAVLWGLILPAVTLVTLILWPMAGLALLLIWPLQALRLWRRYGDLAMALAMTFGKLAEGQGVLTYWWRRLTRAQARLIEYK